MLGETGGSFRDGSRRDDGWLGFHPRAHSSRVSRPAGQPHRESAPLPRSALDLDAPPHPAHQVMRDRQAQPSPLVGAIATGGFLPEVLEEMGQELRADADSGVLHLQ